MSAGEHRESREPGRESLELGNEFAEIRVSLVRTRNGARLLIESPKSGHAVALCPYEVEALTWQNTETFSAMIGKPGHPLIDPEPEPELEPEADPEGEEGA